MENNLHVTSLKGPEWKWKVLAILLWLVIIHSHSIIQAQPAPCTGTITPATGTICRGEQFGLIVSGGTSYQWYKDGVKIEGATSASLLITEGGEYTADIINSGCVGKASNASIITEAFEEEATISPYRLTICNGGSGLLTATGGTSYQWYLNGSIIAGAESSIFMVTEPGTYTIDVIKDNCTWREAAKAFVEMREDLSGPLQPASAVLCPGDSIILSAEGGITYKWYKNNVLIDNATSATFTVKEPGTYAFELFRGECRGKSSNNSVITKGIVPTGVISPATGTLCGNGTKTLTVNGGIKYQWYRNDTAISGTSAASYAASKPGTYTASVIGETGCVGKASNESILVWQAKPVGRITPAVLSICDGNTGLLTADGGTSYQWYLDGTAINGASAATLNVTESGNYTVDIISGSCKAVATNDANVTVTPRPKGAINPTAITICSGETGTLTASGGVSYQWYKDGLAINGAIQNTLTIREAGIYSADIINGDCSAKTDNEVVASISNKPSGTITPAIASICEGNAVTLTATGGASYQWYKDGLAISGATVATYNASLPGQYSVTIVNGNCSGPSANTANVSYSNAISFKTTTTAAGCTIASGTITIGSVEGGSGTGYQFSKDNGQTYQDGKIFTGLAPGQYQVVVKDKSGCKSEPVTVSIKQAENTLNVSAAITDIVCGQQFGMATISVTGGQAPYTYSLNGEAVQANNVFNNLVMGNYTVLVKDAAGCSAESKFTIKQLNSTLNATANVTNPTCSESVGKVDVSATGGTPDYQFSLDNGVFQASSTFTNVLLGKHSIKVKDKMGCTLDVAFEVKSAAPAPLLMVTNPAAICEGATISLKDVSITAGSEGGLAFSYWTNSAATSVLGNPEAVGAGTYYIKGTNAEGCFTIKPVVVSINNTSAGTITPASPSAVCNGEFLTLTASTGVTYQWYKDGVAIAGATAASYKVLQAGRYGVMINNGSCSALASNTVVVTFQVCVPTGETKVFVPTAFTPDRNGENDLLQPYFINIRQLVQFKVFNRWGQQVYQTNIIGQGWDGTLKGTPQPAETYSWILECIDFDGKVIRQSGRSVLIR
jgi:trimeric autotransporter adhesin